MIFIAKALTVWVNYPSTFQICLSTKIVYRGQGRPKIIILIIPSTRTELGKKAFSSYAPKVRNELQNTINL